MAKVVITKIIITIMMRMRINIRNHMKIWKNLNITKSVHIKAMLICLKGRSVQNTIFYWNEKNRVIEISKTKYKGQNKKQ